LAPTAQPPASPISDVIPVTVLTGFLGAGKTTLLSRLLRDPALKDTAVIINEFGEVGLDHLLVEKSGENFVELSSGCLCCTIRGDLIDTLRELFMKRVKSQVPWFKRVVIETTGLADPAPILHTLLNDPLVAANFALDGVITVIDAVNGYASLDAHPEALKQAAVADRLVISKTDLPEAKTAALTARLKALNPAALYLTPDEAMADPGRLLSAGLFDVTGKSADVDGWLRAEAYEGGHEGHDHHDHGHDHGHAHHGHEGHDHAALDVNRHDDHIRSYSIIRDKPIGGVAFTMFLELLVANKGDDLLRVKGLLNIAERPGQPAVLHGVQHIFHPVSWLDQWPSDDHRSKIVFITRDIPREHIDSLLKALEGQSDMTDAEIDELGNHPALQKN
jgi:G3E family GTPase